jgi:hypothetical protein
MPPAHSRERHQLVGVEDLVLALLQVHWGPWKMLDDTRGLDDLAYVDTKSNFPWWGLTVLQFAQYSL